VAGREQVHAVVHSNDAKCMEEVEVAPNRQDSASMMAVTNTASQLL